MDFGLSPEQALFDDALVSWVEGAVPTGRVRRVMVTEEGTEDAIWTELGRLGVPGILSVVRAGRVTRTPASGRRRGSPRCR